MDLEFIAVLKHPTYWCCSIHHCKITDLLNTCSLWPCQWYMSPQTRQTNIATDGCCGIDWVASRSSEFPTQTDRASDEISATSAGFCRFGAPGMAAVHEACPVGQTDRFVFRTDVVYYFLTHIQSHIHMHAPHRHITYTHNIHCISYTCSAITHTQSN